MKTKTKVATIAVALAVCGAVPAALAEAEEKPVAVAFRGILNSDLGAGKSKKVPLSGTHSIGFRLYSSEKAKKADALWGRKQSVLLSSEGEFYVTLSDTVGESLYNEEKKLADAIHSGAVRNNDLYVGITVDEGSGGSEITPRTLFVTVPYAQYANDALSSRGNFSVARDLTVMNDMTIGGSLIVDCTMTATNNPSGSVFGGGGTIPIGGVIMWSGDLEKLPDGWALCDGTNGTPDLRGRFLVGRDGVKFVNPGDIDGEKEHTLTLKETPSHKHSYDKMVWSANTFDGTDLQSKVENCIGSGRYEEFSVEEGNNKSSDIAVMAHENRPRYYTLAYIMRTK